MKYKVGQPLAVVFLDHHMHKGDVEHSGLRLEVLGRVTRQDRLHLVLSMCHDADNFAERSSNCEEFSIVKKAIVKVTRLG